MRLFFLISAILIICPNAIHSQGIAQFRRPASDGIFPDKGLLKSWPENGPEIILPVEGIGRGYSSAVMYNGEELPLDTSCYL